MVGRVRERTSAGDPAGSHQTIWPRHPQYSDVNPYYSGLRTFDKSSKCIDITNPGPPYRSGGSLFIEHKGYECESQPFESQLYANLAYTKGRRFISPPTSPPTLVAYEPFELWAHGSTGFNRAKPAAAKADLAVAMAESRDLPRLFSKGSFGTLGREFGWEATSREFQSIDDAFGSLLENFSQIWRDNGQHVRRGARILKDEYIDVTTDSGYFVWPTKGLASGPQTRIRTDIVRNHVWYVGKFRYYIPEELRDPKWLPLWAAYHFGLTPSIGVVWEATPFSWLMDYFVTAGDFLSNLHNSFNMIQEYGYVMGLQERISRYEVRYTDTDMQGKPYTRYITSSRYHTVKQRVVGSPYGFGPTATSLTNEQIAIIGSLLGDKRGRASL